MIEQTKNNVVSYYYDSHPTEEDLMGETALHVMVIRYLVSVLTWLFEGQDCAIHQNLNFYQTSDPAEYPLAPDIAVIKGVAFTPVNSWRIGKTGPAPQVVFEIASEKTWERDLQEKPSAYAALGVQEYYAYDPYDPPLLPSRRKGQRLFGWNRDRRTGTLHTLPLQTDGSLWSPHLDSFLVPDSSYLRLSDPSGKQRLTKEEAETQAKRAAMQEAESQAQRAAREAERARTFAEKLRSLGVDPEQLL